MESQCGITEHFKKVEHSNYMLEHTPFRDILHRKKIEKTYFKKLDCNRGIISFSDANDNLLLWDRFAKYNTGFVIGFDSNFIIQENIPIGMFSKINYYNIDFPPKIHALRSFFNPDSM